MAVYENRPNIVVDENFLMLEKRLKRRHANSVSAYSNAEAIEQERHNARACAIAPEAYGDSKSGMAANSFAKGKYMTADDYVAYFGMCHDTFGAMNIETVAPAKKVEKDSSVVSINRAKLEQIQKLNAKAAKANAKKQTVVKKRPAAEAVKEEKKETVVISESKLEAFFAKLSSVKGRAMASVAAIAVCCTIALGGVVAAIGTGDEAPAPVDNIRTANALDDADDEAHANMLSTLE